MGLERYYYSVNAVKLRLCTVLRRVLYPELNQIEDQLNVLNNKFGKSTSTKCKKRRFSIEERKQIYRKTKGHCYLCGEFVDFDAFEIEHRIPRSKGGTNDLKNLYCSCHICNLIKHDIYPQDFNERITKIFMYQMEKKTKHSLKWKIVHRLLLSCIKS